VTSRDGEAETLVAVRDGHLSDERRIRRRTHGRYYALFFDNDAYKGERLSVILDQRETQTFKPLPAVALVPVVTKVKPAVLKNPELCPQNTLRGLLLRALRWLPTGPRGPSRQPGEAFRVSSLTRI
jgi:hypothetical protein